jgi:hypothetical protein
MLRTLLLVALAFGCDDGGGTTADLAVPDLSTPRTDAGCQPVGGACSTMSDCCQPPNAPACQTCDGNKHQCIGGCA